jgi:serine phosphatase RsbU (regulator of sigma subunit)/PAS domain-containing protein
LSQGNELNRGPEADKPSGGRPEAHEQPEAHERPGGHEKPEAHEQHRAPGQHRAVAPVPASSSPLAHGLPSYLQAIIEASRDAVLAVSPDRRVLAVSRRFCQLWGLAPGSVVVGGPSPALSSGQRALISDPDAFERAIRWGHEHPDELQYLDVSLVDGRLIEGYAAPVIDGEGGYLGRVWYMRDETERRATEQRHARLLAELAAAQTAQKFLLDASEVLAAVSGFSEILESLARTAVPTLGDICLIDVLDERGQVERMAAVDAGWGGEGARHGSSRRAELVRRLRQYPPDPEGSHPSVLVMRDGESRWASDMPADFVASTSRGDLHRQIMEELGFGSYMCVPLVSDQGVLGAVTLVSAGSGRRFGRRDLALAEDLARRMALVVAKERRYDVERASSHALQTSLLPGHSPGIPGAELAVRYVPGTRDAEVGGDFWDVARLPGGEVALAVGDVAGHDMIAAATMAQLRSACRALRSYAPGPSELIAALQANWDQLELDRIATAVFAAFAPGTGEILVASAGHPGPLLLQRGQASFAGVDAAPPLGAPPAPAGLWRGALGPGDLAVFFTDGLVEDRHRSLDEGLDLLRLAAERAPATEPSVFADHILSELVPGPERGDDVALVVLRRA